MKRGSREYTLTTVGLVAIIVLSLFPVFWLLMLSLKSPATIGDGRLIPAV
jgi:multiple sugar transport system permease protein